MAEFDRDATLERKQIREISLNVARRLHQVLNRDHYIPAAMAAEVDSTVRVITGIQRDIEQIMGALPADEALDFAILTHILGGQRHALDLLEILESKLEGGRGQFQRDSTRAHQALLAVSREIEQDARRSATDGAVMQRSPGGPRFAPPPGGPAPYPRAAGPRPSAGPGAPAPRGPTKKQPKKRASNAAALAALRAFAAKPLFVALAALTVGAGLAVGGMYLKHAGGSTANFETAATSPPESSRPETPPAPPPPAANAALTEPAVEQPFLVVLATRRSTEELQQDYRSFKASYPDLLGAAKARVDRVQGQDKETYYRLSLIPPQARDDAKTLCSSLRKAGLTGCWIKPVPLH